MDTDVTNLGIIMESNTERQDPPVNGGKRHLAHDRDDVEWKSDDQN